MSLIPLIWPFTCTKSFSPLTLKYSSRPLQVILLPLISFTSMFRGLRSHGTRTFRLFRKSPSISGPRRQTQRIRIIHLEASRFTPESKRSFQLTKRFPRYSKLYLQSFRQSGGWWPPWGRGEASGSRRCWWSRSGCVYVRSAAPRAGSPRSTAQTCQSGEGQFGLDGSVCVRYWCLYHPDRPSVSSPRTSCLPPVRRETRTGSSSLGQGKSGTEKDTEPFNWSSGTVLLNLSAFGNVLPWHFKKLYIQEKMNDGTWNGLRNVSSMASLPYSVKSWNNSERILI